MMTEQQPAQQEEQIQSRLRKEGGKWVYDWKEVALPMETKATLEGTGHGTVTLTEKSLIFTPDNGAKIVGIDVDSVRIISRFERDLLLAYAGGDAQYRNMLFQFDDAEAGWSWWFARHILGLNPRLTIGGGYRTLTDEEARQKCTEIMEMVKKIPEDPYRPIPSIGEMLNQLYPIPVGVQPGNPIYFVSKPQYLLVELTGYWFYTVHKKSQEERHQVWYSGEQARLDHDERGLKKSGLWPPPKLEELVIQ